MIILCPKWMINYAPMVSIVQERTNLKNLLGQSAESRAPNCKKNCAKL